MITSWMGGRTEQAMHVSLRHGHSTAYRAGYATTTAVVQRDHCPRSEKEERARGPWIPAASRPPAAARFTLKKGNTPRPWKHGPTWRPRVGMSVTAVNETGQNKLQLRLAPPGHGHPRPGWAMGKRGSWLALPGGRGAGPDRGQNDNRPPPSARSCPRSPAWLVACARHCAA